MLLEKLTIKVFKEPRLILKFFSEMKKSGLKGSLNKVRSANKIVNIRVISSIKSLIIN